MFPFPGLRLGVQDARSVTQLPGARGPGPTPSLHGDAPAPWPRVHGAAGLTRGPLGTRGARRMCEQSGYESRATPRLVPAQCAKPPGAFPLPRVPEPMSGNA